MNQQETIPVSVLIITHRKDERFQHCLDSVSWADEVRIIETEQPITDFSQLKNQALAELKHDWVLFLDSDEIVSPELAALIPSILEQNDIAGAAIRRIDYFFGKEMKWGEVRAVYPIRLAKKNLIRFSRPVHEVAEIQGEVAEVSAPLQHFAHTSISEFWQKISRYAVLEAEYRFSQNQTTSWLSLICYPLGKFGYNYLLKLGFLDGMRGLIYAVMMSCHSLIVRAKLYELSSMGSKRT